MGYNITKGTIQMATTVCLSGFSLNGELMMDRMGQEIAFKGIALSCKYVPAFSLSAGQHARVNFGQVRSPSLLPSSTTALRNFIAHLMTICAVVKWKCSVETTNY